MGLDMCPMGKPKPGCRKRFRKIFEILTGIKVQKLSLLDRMTGVKKKTKSQLLKEWNEIQIQSYETLKAPKVGRDKEAQIWLKELYENSDKKLNLNQLENKYRGYYIIELSKEQDGVPVYKSFNQDQNVFRGEFLKNCVELIGEDLVAEAWQNKLDKETLDYGKRLLQRANEIAKTKGLEYLKDQKHPPDSSPESDESKLHVVYSLSKWLIFYGKNGHGYEADY